MSTVNLNDTTPAAPAGVFNVKWLSDASGNISANIPLNANVKYITADYTATSSDQYIIAFPGTTTITFPASPTANQLLTIRNHAALSPSLTINGNGFNVSGTPTNVLYTSSITTYWFDTQSGTNQWRAISYNPSGWINWTPTIASNNVSTTTSGLSITAAQWQWLNSGSVMFQIMFSVTLGGTVAANQITATSPLTVVGTVFPNVCWVQEPGQSLPQTQYFCRPDSTGIILFRRIDASNLPLGAYGVQAEGFYRIG